MYVNRCALASCYLLRIFQWHHFTAEHKWGRMIIKTCVSNRQSILIHEPNQSFHLTLIIDFWKLGDKVTEHFVTRVFLKQINKTESKSVTRYMVNFNCSPNIPEFIIISHYVINKAIKTKHYVKSGTYRKTALLLCRVDLCKVLCTLPFL